MIEIQANNSNLAHFFPDILENELQISFDDGKTYQSLKFSPNLLCPKCGCDEITKQGMDYRLKTPKQRYGCKKCGKKFYLNTSGIMQKNLITLYQDLLQSRYEDGERIRTIAKRYGISESTVSKEIKWIKNRVINHLQDLPCKPPLSEIF
ncbi:MAG: transposase [Candidatus Helarchaeota archaeon]